MDDFEDDDIDEELAKELAHSRPLDVHVWSEHPEANKFVDGIYAEFFKERKAEIAKKHLKVVVLDLYVAWTEDPTLKIAVPRNVNVYKAKSRYNELHISAKVISVVDTLKAAGLIDGKDGFFNHHEGSGRVSRIWPTEDLVERFKQALFTEFDIQYQEDRKAVILRTTERQEGEDGRARKTDVEFVDDANTLAMEKMLKDYNALLRRTFIDIPILDDKGILNGIAKQPEKKPVSLRDKFVRRVFNRHSFDCGGRFYGGFWQRCPKEWRSHIFINRKPTNELDFSGLHIVMAYALKGICYWREFGNDPYTIEPLDFAQDDAFRRSICKSLMLVLLNAKDKKAAFKAFRSQAKDGSPEKQFKDQELEVLYQALVRKHEPIKDCFHTDQGIHLMNLDSQITERILAKLTAQGIPVLALHDSYIVPCGYEGYLERLMKDAFKAILGVSLVMKDDAKGDIRKPDAIKEGQERLEDLENRLMAIYMPYEELQDIRLETEKRYYERVKPANTDRYINHLNKYNTYMRI